jgi:hypothetical protein
VHNSVLICLLAYFTAPIVGACLQYLLAGDILQNMMAFMLPADCQVLGHEHRRQAQAADGAGHVDREGAATKQCCHPAQQWLLQQVSSIPAFAAPDWQRNICL